MKNDVITICIPIYNAEEYLEDAINSVLNQTYSKWRLILLNDGSTDGSMRIAESFLYDSRISILDDGSNKGLIYRLNESIRMTDTKYYVRMDSDDIMHYDRIRTQLEILESNPSIDVIGSNVYSIGQNNEILGVRKQISDGIQSTRVFVHPSIIGKTEWFKANPYLDIAVRMEDSELWYRTRGYSCFFEICTPLLFYREFGGVYYKKYFKAFPSEIKLSWYYFKQRKYIFSFRWLKQSFMLIVKGLVYRVFALLNKEQLLINKRNIVMSTSEIMNAEEELFKSLKR